MTLADVLGGIVRKPSESYATFALDRADGNGQDRFVPDETYVEIRLAQMHLRDQRRLWREFVPLATVITELQFGDRREVVPFVVGPDLLAQAPNRDEGALVEFYNRRVAGPFPYAGDDLVLFAGLSALESENWAKRALSVLGAVASTLDVTRISGYLDVAGALTNALQGLLGMNEVEQRVAVERSFSTPPNDPEADAPEGALKPAFHVFVNAPSRDFPARRLEGMTMADGRLHEGGREFTDADFLVLEVIPLQTRPDLTKFDFHRVHWRDAEKKVIDGHPDEAWNHFTLLANALITSDDLTLSHRDALLEEYADRLQAAIERRDRIFRRGGRQRLQGAGVSRRLGEEELNEAVRRRRPAEPRKPEALAAAAQRRVLSALS